MLNNKLHRKYPSQRMIKIGLNCLTFLASTIICMVTYSNPVLNSVTAGNATVAQTSNSTVINQTSQQAIIQWNSFNIAAGQKTQFVQPNASSVALNRINPAQGVSQIYGSLSANGRIILINAAGIHFGPSSMVNVGGMIASTSDISNANFLAGNYIFSIPSALNGSIKNEGKIIAAQHGLIALLGANVQNNGLIQAEKGSIVLGSGNIFTLDFYGDQLINFTVNEAASTGGQIKNTGALLADGGKVLVTADAAQNVLDNVIDMAGVTEARSVSNTNGEIILSGNGEVSVSGVLSVMGLQNATGGIIEVLGQSVHLLSTAKLNANGGSGGGTILVGGNFHGAGPEQNALTTTVDAGAVLTANAGLTGNGGHVAIWSNDDTQFAGSISATGGALGGNGGYVETSGSYLDVSGATVNTLAPNGITGSWLLDPTNIYIASSQANATTAGMSGTNTSANTISSGTFAGTGSIQDSLLTTATLDTALATTNVLVTTTNASGTGLGNIIVVNPITWATTKTLTLNAANNIIVNSNLLSPTITATAGGSLTLTAVNQIQLNGGITLTGTTTANGILTLSAANTTNSITTANAVSGTSIGGAINAENFTLSAGEFNQNSATLPTFNITYNFQISSGSAFNNEYNAQFTRFTGGSGTLTSPYQISDIYGLQGMSTAAFTNDYALTQNISATPTTNWFAGAGFSPVGTNQNYAYLGTFNGQNFTINGLYIHTSNNNIGLFGYADNPALLENVGLTNASIYGARFVGALVGSSGYFTSILGFSAQNVYSTGTITATNGYVGGLFGGTGYGGQILNSYSTANVISTGATDTAGGFAGQNFGSLISESYATGSVTQSAGSNNIGVGGFVGVSWVGATIQDSYSTGAVTVTGSASNKYVGGFAGQNQALIQNSYSTGNVSVSGTTTAVGGFVGINTNTTGATTPPNILNSYSTGSVTASSNAGGLVGTNTSDIGNSYTNSLLIGTTALGGLVGNNSGTITESFWNTSTTGISSLSQGCGNSANCAGATGLSMTALQTASTYTNSGWDFTTPIWTLLAGNYPVNWVIQNISGTDTGATSAPSIAVNGASVPATASIVTFSSGTYHYYLNSAALQNSAILLYNNNNGGTVSNIILPPTFPTNSYTANFGAANTIQVSNNSLSAALSNSLLANAVGTLSVGNANILYSASGTNLTIGNATNPNVTLTLATPAYALSGNLTTTGSGSFTFNGPLSLGVNNTTVSTTGSIVFGGPISWGTNNSLTVSGSNITLASNGLSAAINASSGGNLTLTASNQIQLNGGISLTGTTTLNGFLTLSAANTANSITTANAVSGTSVGGSINVENYNLLQGQWTQISTSLPAFTVTNNFELNTGTIPVSTVQFIRALSGTGSSNSPYLITDVYGLQGIGSSLTSVTQNYALNNNIDATVTANWNSGTGFVPLGNNTYQLTGNFNGQGFTINNLFINRPAGSNQGLIGVTSGNISNVGVTNANMTVGGTSGILVGATSGNVFNTYTTGSIVGTSQLGGLIGSTAQNTTSTVENSYSTASVTSNSVEVGGLIGQSRDLVLNCYATGTVTETGNNQASIGGLVGWNLGGYNPGFNAIIQNSYATGNVVVTGSGNSDIGGLVGTNTGDGYYPNTMMVINSYSTGNVTGGTNSTAVGGLVGYEYNPGNFTSNYVATIQNSYSTGSVTGTTDVGGLVGLLNPYTSVTTSYSTGSVTGTTNVGGLVGLNNGLVTNSFWDITASGQSTGINNSTGTSSNVIGGTLNGSVGVNLSSQATYTAEGWDFTTPVWTLVPGNYPVNWIFTNVTGTDTGATSAPSFAINGSNSSPFALMSFSNGSYNLYLNSTALQGGSGAVLLYNNNNGGTVSNIVLPLIFPGSTFTANFGTAATIQVNNNNLTTALSNSILATAVGTLGSGNSNILYSASANNLTIGNATNPNVTLTLATPAYTLNGNITSTGTGNFNFNGPLSLSSNATVSTVGNITFNSPISWSTSNTLSVAGHNITLSSNGLSDAVTATAGGNLTLTAASQILLNGGITLTGTSTSNGTLTLSAANTTNSITPANPVTGVSEGAAINVENFILSQGQFNQNNSVLPTFNAVNNFQIGTGTFYNNNFNAEFTRYTGGAGTSPSPYQVTDIYGLQGLATGSLTSNYILTQNISAVSTHTWNSGTGFAPIGSANNANFTGSFNGQNHVVDSLYINLPSTYNVGLFGGVDAGAVIQNIGVTNSTITGNTFVGALIGDLYSTGLVNSTITNTYSTGNVTGNSRVGGLIGINTGGNVSDSYSAVTVVSTADNAGGLIGFMSINSGTLVPGLTNSYSTGTVTGSTSNIGGLIGFYLGGSVSNSYSTSNVTGGSNVGGLIGFLGLQTATVNNSYSTGHVTGSTYTAGLVGQIETGGSISNSFWDITSSGNSIGVNNTSGTVTNVQGGTLNGSVGVNLSSQSTYTAAGWDFTTPVWTLIPGNYPVNWVIQTVTGTDTGATSAPSFAINGSNSSSVALTGLSNGSYDLYLNSTALQGGNVVVLLYNNNNGGTVSNIVLPLAVSSNSLTANFGAANTIQVNNNNSTTALSNSLLATAVGTLSINNSNILYSASGNNLTIGNATNPNVTLTLATPAYTMNGNITSTGTGNFNFNGPLSLSANNTTVSTAGNITFSSPISWSTSNTLSVAGNNITLSSNGLSDEVTATAGGSLSLSAASQILLNGGITLTGTSTSNGTLTLSAANTTNSIAPANPVAGVSEGAAINVENFILSQGQWNQNNSVLPNFNVVNNFQIATGTSYNGTYNAKFTRYTGGAGTSLSYYQVADLFGLQGMVTGSLSSFYELTQNINAASTVNWNSGAGFVPIGNNTVNFNGTLNGQNFVINGLFISRASTGNVGLFGNANGGSTLENIGITNANVTGATTTGILAGAENGVIQNAYTSGSVLGVSQVGGLIGSNGGGASIYNSYSAANVTGSGIEIGGLVGQQRGVTSGSYATGVVTATGNNMEYIGGLIGWNSASTLVTDSYATGNVIVTGTNANSVGGLIGLNPSATVISNDYSTGTVTAGSGSTNVGGLIGYNSVSNGLIENSYSTSNVSGGTNVGGLIGNLPSTDTLKNSYSTGTVSGTSNVGGLVGTNSGTIIGSFWNTSTSGITSLTQGCGNSVSCAGVTGISSATMMTASTFVNANWDFTTTPIWGILNGITYPYLAWNELGISGTDINATSAPTVAVNGVNLAGSAFAYSAVNSGNYYLLIKQSALANNSALLLYNNNNGGVISNIVLPTVSNLATITNANFSTDSLQVNNSALTTVLSNNALATAVGTLSSSNANVLYSASGNNLTIGNSTNPNINFNAVSAYSLNGNITNSGTGTIAFQGAVSLGTANTINVTGNNAITFASTIDGASSLTLNSIASKTLDGIIGGMTSLINFSSQGNGENDLNATAVNTSGNQTYSSLLTLGANTILTSQAGVISLNGVTGADNLNLSGASSFILAGNLNVNALVVSGGGSNNTLSLQTNTTNTWNISGTNSGTVGGAGSSLQFSNIQNLVGGNTDNTFNLNGGSLSGTLTGGTGNNTLIDNSTGNTWYITGANSGSLTGIGGFSQIQNLTGGSGNNSFVFSNAGSLSGTLNGGNTANTTTLDFFSNYNGAINAMLTTYDMGYVLNSANTLIAAFSNINSLLGSAAGNNTLSLQTNTANTWNISGANSGTVGGAGSSLQFSHIQNLVGGNSGNTFNLNGGSLAGTLSGGYGYNTLSSSSGSNTFYITGTNSGSLGGIGGFSQIQSLTGGSGSNSFVFSNGGSLSGTVNGGNTATLDFSSNYSGALNIVLTADHSGYAMNNSNAILNSFININSILGNGQAQITVPSNGKMNMLYINGVNQGSINDPVNFSGFNQFTGNNNLQVIFNTATQFNFATGVGYVNGVAMYFSNYAGVSGNLIVQTSGAESAAVLTAIVSPYAGGSYSSTPLITAGPSSSSSSGSSASDSSTSTSSENESDSSSASSSSSSDSSTSDSSSSSNASSSSSSDSSTTDNSTATFSGSASEAGLQTQLTTSTQVNSNINSISNNQQSTDLTVTNVQKVSTNCS